MVPDCTTTSISFLEVGRLNRFSTTFTWLNSLYTMRFPKAEHQAPGNGTVSWLPKFHVISNLLKVFLCQLLEVLFQLRNKIVSLKGQ